MLVFGSCGNKVFDLLSVCWVRGSGDYDRKKKDTVVCLTGCAVVFFFVVAGNFDYDREKKRYSRLLAGNWQFFCCGGKFLLRPEKKKIQSSVWRVVLLCQFLVLAGNRFWFYILLMYLGYRTIQLWCCVSFFGSGRK